MGSVQEALLAANERLRYAKRNRGALGKRITTLELELDQLRGRDFAIEVSNKQTK